MVIIAGIIFIPGMIKPYNPYDISAITELPIDEAVAPGVLEDTETATPEPTITETPLPTDTPTITLSPTPEFERIGKGGKVAFISNRSADGVFQIWTMNVFIGGNGELTTDDPVQITFDEYDKADPAWSPDGTKILYSAEGDPADGHLGKEVWVLDLEKPDVPAKNLTYQNGDDFGPFWAQDGSYIAFANFGRYSEVHQLYIMEPDGGNMRRIISEYDEYDPFWTPDMEFLISINNARGHQYLYRHIWEGDTYPTPFPTPRPFDRQTTFGQLGEVSDPNMSADGLYLVYSRIQGRIYQIYSFETRYFGADKTLLTPDTTYNRWPVWSPDRSWIIYTAYGVDGVQEDLFIMTSTGLLKTNLTMNEANDRQAAWQPILVEN